MIQAKFICTQINKTKTSEEAHLRPVYGDSEANKSFSQYTPSGKLELMITNPDALGKFVPGKEYFLNISEAPEKDIPSANSNA